MNPLAAHDDPLLGTVLGGRYRLEHRLGQGGMGTVYDAADAEGRRYAVKVIRPELMGRLDSAMERFVNEARAVAGVESPHVLGVRDSGVDPVLGTAYLVMELLTGCDTESLLARVGPLEPEIAVRIALQAARGLAAVHRNGVIHRDIKPSNLFLHSGPGGDVTVRVCDFGTAKLLSTESAQITRTGAILGSPLYMSPEQARSAKHVDTRADVFSLGVSLYQMLSGVTPHQAHRSIAELIVSICSRDAPHLQDVAPWIDPRLTVAVHAALLRGIDERWPTVNAFADALRPFAGGNEQIQASHLSGVRPERRAQIAVRASLPSAAPPVQSAPTSESDRLVGTVLSRRFRLVSLLGRGGMGAVYEAEDPSGARCAVKVILADIQKSPDALRRFVREARTSTEIRSPNVVSVIEADTDSMSGTPYIAMELLSGLDVSALVEGVGPLDPTAAARIFVQACHGLAAAHARSIVHRDIKPANIFLHHDKSGEITVKICDFGIAKSTGSDAINQATAALTATGGLLGSPVYMSPEQARNAKHVDARTDVWSLCISMYETLSGTHPWPDCTTVGEFILAICTEDIRPLRKLAPWIDPALAKVIERGLRRGLGERWPSIEELARALEPFTAGTERLHGAELVGVSREARALAASPVDPSAATVSASTFPSALGAVSTMTGSSLSASQKSRTTRVRGGLAMGALALSAGAALWVFTRRPTPPVSSPPTNVAQSMATSAPPDPAVPAPPAPAQTSVRVTIRPPNATVTVDGAVKELVAGDLVLNGNPGDSIHVVASLGSTRVEKTVAILKDGVAEPSLIEVASPARPGAVGTPGGAVKVGARAAPPAAAPTSNPTPAPAAKPNTATVSSAPKLQHNW